MGNNQTHQPYQNEKPSNPIKQKSYSSKFDSIFNKFETEFNILKYLEIREFQQILLNFKSFSSETEANASEKKEFLTEIDDVFFKVFIENKLLNHFLIFNQISNNDKKISIISQFYSNFFSILQKNYSYYNKKISDHKYDSDNKKSIRKICLLAYAFLYTKGETYEKYEYLYHLLCDENGEISKTDDFEDFFFFLFIVPSNVFIYSIYSLGEEYNEFSINQDVFQQIYDSFEVKDSKALAEKFFSVMFLEKQSLSQQEFLNKLVNNDWIFSPAGIRKTLEDNNIN
jgi:hypothetical protein